MLTPEERARIARENGAKSHGPKTEEGKARSARNALKDGQYAEVYAHFVPPHEAVLCNEDRVLYQDLVQELVDTYQPKNGPARAIIGDMAIARWQIERLHRCVTMQWNLAFIQANKQPRTVAPELSDIQTMSAAVADLLSGNNLLTKMNREIARLQQSLARSERRLKFLHANFAEERTNTPTEENKPLTQTEPIIIEGNEPALYTTENDPIVIEAYKQEFPGRKIVILPVSAEDDDPYKDSPGPYPRRAA